MTIKSKYVLLNCRLARLWLYFVDAGSYRGAAAGRSSLRPHRIYYANELARRPIARPLAPVSPAYMMRRGRRGVCGAAARRSAQSLCAPSRLAALRSRPGQTSRPAAIDNHNNALIFLPFFYSFSTAGWFACRGFYGRGSMNSQCYTVAMDLGVCQLRNFSISFLSSVLGKESASVRVDSR